MWTQASAVRHAGAQRHVCCCLRSFCCCCFAKFLLLLLHTCISSQKVEKSKSSFWGDGGIGAALRLAAHRAADTNAPGGHLNKTPGEGVSLVPACAILGPPSPKAPPSVLVPAKGQADWAAAWVHGAAGTRAPGGHLALTLGEVDHTSSGAFGGV